MDINATADIAENFNGNPPIIERPIGVIAEGIHQRILAEQQKLHAEEKSERDLTTKRIALLTNGSDKDVDDCELAIDQSRNSQMRCLERIELLAEQLKLANRTAESQRLDEIAASAKRAHDRAASLLKKYPKAARELAVLLGEVKGCEDQIAAANLVLASAKRATVESADPKRFRITGHMGLVLDIVALHEFVNLPNESDGLPYWSASTADELQASVYRAAFGLRSDGTPTDIVAASSPGEQ